MNWDFIYRSETKEIDDEVHRRIVPYNYQQQSIVNINYGFLF